LKNSHQLCYFSLGIWIVLSWVKFFVLNSSESLYYNLGTLGLIHQQSLKNKFYKSYLYTFYGNFNIYCIYTYIHCLPGSEVGLRRQQVQEKNSDIPVYTLLLLLGNRKAFPGQKGYIIPLACSGSALGPTPTWTCPENFQICPNHLSWLLSMWRSSGSTELIPDGQAPYSVYKAEPSQPPKETILATFICDLILLVTNQISWP